jgi:hypothetical protein
VGRLRAGGRAGFPVDAGDDSSELLHALAHLTRDHVIGCEICSHRQCGTWPVFCSGLEELAVLAQGATLLDEGTAVCRS